VNWKIAPHYMNSRYRRLKLNSFINTQKSETRFLNRFQKLFGSSENVIIGIGDYDQYKQRKFKEPIKGKGFRTMFRKYGYDIYLVDEHKTSCRCNNCHGEAKTFRECKNPRPEPKNEERKKKYHKTILRHGLLICQRCKSLWNRDLNASLNIYSIVKSHIDGNERPKYLQRSKICSGATSVSHIDYTRDAKTKHCEGEASTSSGVAF